MEILITGRGGKAGSWQVRGDQLGRAMGAVVMPLADKATCEKAGVIVAVKRVSLDLLQAIRASGRPWVWDIVDAWPQPYGNLWTRKQSLDWLGQELDILKPNAVVVSTTQLLRDVKEFTEVSCLILPHHSWGKYVDHTPTTRHSVKAVGYEGAENYLGDWRRVVQRECDKRGWEFIVNGDMRRIDIGLALRQHDGYPAAMWKPNTKLSNIHALGVPAICSHELGYKEIASGGEFWVRSASDLADVFDILRDPALRESIGCASRDSMLPVSFIAAKYHAWLRRLNV